MRFSTRGVDRTLGGMPPRVVAGTVAASLAVLLGCGRSVPVENGTRSSAESDSRAVTTSAHPGGHPAGGVPDVIVPPRPFRIADVIAVPAPDARPATLGSRVPTLPIEASSVAPESIRTVAATEPPGRLWSEAAAASLVGEIREMVSAYRADFNRHDADAVAAHWTSRGESLNLDSGELTAGREAVRELFAQLFETDAAVSLDVDLSSIRPVRADVALVDGRARLGSAGGPMVASLFSAVLVREDGRWFLDSMRETAAKAVEVPARPLDELAWLIGYWEDVGEGVTAGTRCDWSPGRGFLVRQHVVSPDRRPADLPRSGDQRIPALLSVGSDDRSELTELIGWDPERQEIRSWIFAADGRFAEATWRRAGDGWAILVEGRGADSGRTAECTLQSDGADGLVIQCDGDALGGLVPPACDFTRTAR